MSTPADLAAVVRAAIHAARNAYPDSSWAEQDTALDALLALVEEKDGQIQWWRDLFVRADRQKDEAERQLEEMRRERDSWRAETETLLERLEAEEREKRNWHASNYAERQARLKAERERDKLTAQLGTFLANGAEIIDARDAAEARAEAAEREVERLKDALRKLTRSAIATGHRPNDLPTQKQLEAAVVFARAALDETKEGAMGLVDYGNTPGTTDHGRGTSTVSGKAKP